MYNYIPILFIAYIIPNYKFYYIQYKYSGDNINEKILYNEKEFTKDLIYYKNNKTIFTKPFTCLNKNLEMTSNIQNIDDYICKIIYDDITNNKSLSEQMLNKLINSKSELKFNYMNQLFTIHSYFFIWNKKSFIYYLITHKFYDVIDNIIKQHYIKKHDINKFQICCSMKNILDDNYYCIFEYLNTLYLNNPELFEYMKKHNYFLLYTDEFVNAHTILNNNNDTNDNFLQLYNNLTQDKKNTLLIDYIYLTIIKLKIYMMINYVNNNGYYDSSAINHYINNNDYIENIKKLIKCGGCINNKINFNFSYDGFKMNELQKLLNNNTCDVI